jgi:hypothetical protein
MTRRKDPARQAESGPVTPALVAAPALDGAHTFDEPADHSEQQVQAAGSKKDPPHGSEAIPGLPTGRPSSFVGRIEGGQPLIQGV